MKMYVWVRQDISISQQAVQSGHAVAEFLKKNPDTNWNNGTLIYLGVPNSSHFDKIKFQLEYKGIKYEVFREPDMNNEITSISAITEKKIKGKLL